jgi:hypothetical protein
MKKMQWHIQFCWVKAHVGIQGNETAGAMAKEAATRTDTPESYDKVPKSVVKSELEVLTFRRLMSTIVDVPQHYPPKLHFIYSVSEKDCTFFKNSLFGGRHLENFVPMGTAGISIKTRSI